MKAYYIKIEDIYVKAIIISSDGFGFMPTFEKDEAGIFEIEKCNALKNDLLKKVSDLKIEFEEYLVKENKENE